MANKFDNNKPQTRIQQLLPEVYRSDVNEAVFENSFNRHLSKDNTTHVVGYVGQGSPNAIVKRQIPEPTPHRQAYQLQPTMYTKVGDQEYVMSSEAFLKQLELIGVDSTRLPLWGNALQFNWVPPVNVDKLINYGDYFWYTPNNTSALPQYITIENRCRIVQSKVDSYTILMNNIGPTHTIVAVDPTENTITIPDIVVSAFTPGFVFYTKNTADVNLQNKFWTVTSASVEDGNTVIVVEEPMLATAPSGIVSLMEVGDIYQRELACICGGSLGWDATPWDDGQIGNVIWDTALLAAITFATEAEWIAANGLPSALDLWYDTTDNVLKQRDADNNLWAVVVNNFSAVVDLTLGQTGWDFNTSCEQQELNQWSSQNRWIHKTQAQSFANVKRAQYPIIEFNSTVELNQWSIHQRVWKYRTAAGLTFNQSAFQPTRLELEPVKGYVAVETPVSSGNWYVYLFDKTQTTTRDVDYSTIFVPGFRFAVRSDMPGGEIYTVASVETREATLTDPVEVQGQYLITVVKLSETTFTSPLTGGGVDNVRIEPVFTSRGDMWRGYHVHWVLDTQSESTTAVQPQQWNPLLRRDIDTPPPYAISPQGFQRVGQYYQETQVNSSGETTFMLDSSLIYDPVLSQPFAIAGANQLRVYIDNIRQYGNYVELTGSGIPNYTVIGNLSYTSMTFEYVTGIQFTSAVPQYAVIRIEVGPAAFVDMGNHVVPVRTTESDTLFAVQVANGTQPAYQPLCTYDRIEQNKQQRSQYPLFNIFDVVTNEVIKASPIFKYAESADAPINAALQQRAIISPDRRNFGFEQTLLLDDNKELYGYRNYSLLTATYWYNPSTQVLKRWDGKAWCVNFIDEINTTDPLVVRRPTIQPSLPPTPQDKDYWFNTATDQLFQYDAALTNWELIDDLVVDACDPSLQTIWKRGTNDEQYVPQYVNANRMPVPIGDPNGAWEVFNQWFYNPEHHNQRYVDYSELITHFRSIIQSQPPVPGFIGGGIYTLTQNQYNYGLGGTIHEYNDSYDTLMSAVNVNNVTPVGVIEFAETRYALALLTVRELFQRNVQTYLTDVTPTGLLRVSDLAADAIVLQYQLNDFNSGLFGDTTAYNKQTNIGVPNWPATVPMFGLSPKYTPMLDVDRKLNVVSVLHHDGHRTNITFTAGEEDILAQAIIAMPDPRVSGQLFGKQSTLAPPIDVANVITNFGTFRTGVFWYRRGGGVRELYRLNLINITPLPPSFYIDGVELPDGVFYYNTTSDTLYVKSGLTWQVVTAVGDGIVDSAWELVKFDEILGGVYVNIEQRLYDVTPEYESLVFDYSTLTPNTSEQEYYDQYLKERFLTYIEERNIVAPFTNVTYNPTNAFSWNYTNSIVNTTPVVGALLGSHQRATWQGAYQYWYNTPYPHLEPWKLQGYDSKPSWWDAEYLDTTGSRRWIYNHATTTGMWENIRIGVVPAGRTYPDGATSTGNPVADQQTLPQYNYFSVNISDGSITGGYASDDLLPPYYSTSDTVVRSLYTSFAGEIVSPGADYVYGSMSPYEWQWNISTERVYDQMVVAFLMQPVRFMHSSFGCNFINVDKLQVETLFKKVYSHEDVLFHGDVYDDNLVYSVNGLNQWYVNFNRYTGFDTNKDFRSMWAGWNPQLTHLFAGIVDTSTLEVTNTYYDVVPQDYRVTLTNTGVIKDHWVDAFNVSVLSIPPALVQYNNQSKWKFSLNTLARVPRTISYYDVKVYPFMVDIATNVATAFRFKVVDVDAANRFFYVPGDYSLLFEDNNVIEIVDSTGNDGTYNVEDVLYDITTNRTRVRTVENIPDATIDGLIDIVDAELPWETGQNVIITSTKNLPSVSPTLPSELTPVFFIRLSAREFQLAEAPIDIQDNTPLTFLTSGDGELSVGQFETSFEVFGGSSVASELWFHYALDRSKVRKLTPPYTVVGMQTLINIIDGYVAVQEESGVAYNLGINPEFDPDTGRTVSWQLETERFINWAYLLRRSRLNVADRFEFDVTDLVADQMSFTSQVPVWENGTAVIVGTTGSLPSPLLPNTPYYFVRTGVSNVFRLASSSRVNVPGSIINITTTGSGTLYLSRYEQSDSFPTFELNPVRNNVWIDTPQGVLSNIVQGPYTDVRVKQTIFDQYGRPLTANELLVYRQDKRSRIAVLGEISNDVSPVLPGQTPDMYSYIHMGGGHFFTEGYEHALLFNDYTVGNNLVYNAFLGLSATKMNLDYYEASNYTLRPSLGGYYLLDSQFYRNIEGQTVDMQNYYDTYGLPENTEVAKYARAILNYKQNLEFLDLLNVNKKAQFVFYKGMLQSKGSINSVTAFINSRRFIDAKLDEFWAWKIATFGDSRPKVYPEIRLFSTDAINEDVRLQFMTATESQDTPDVVQDKALGFEVITMSDSTRWYNYPDQQQILDNSPLFLDGEISSRLMMYASTVPPMSGQETLVDYWFDKGTEELKRWNGSSWDIVNGLIGVDGNDLYIRMDQICDDVRVIQQLSTVPGDLREYSTISWTSGDAINEYQKVNAEVIKFDVDGVQDLMMIFTINPAVRKLNPAKLIDIKANVSVSEVPIWDPARGYYYYVADHNVDIRSVNDPALYTNTENPQQVSQRPWNQVEVGTRWFDISAAQYLPYYDDKVYPNVNDRLYAWGNLADWGDVRVYQWIQTDVAPENYADAVLAQASDPAIPQNQKVTGSVRRTLFKRVRTPQIGSSVGIAGGYQVATPSSYALGTFGSQTISFGGSLTAGTATGMSGVIPFQATIVVDGTPVLVSVTAAISATIGDLLTQLSNDLAGLATVGLMGGNIVITSATRGSTSSIQISDINMFSVIPGFIAVLPATNGNSTTYTFDVEVDGQPSQTLSFRGDDAQTLSSLVQQINSQLTSGTTSIDGSDIRITSDTIGPDSSVLITIGTAFVSANTPVDGTSGKLQVVNDVFENGDVVLFTTTDTLPAPLEASTQYTLSNKTGSGPYTYDIVLQDETQPQELTSVGTGILSIVPTFVPTSWERQQLVRQRIYAAIDLLPVPTTLTSISLDPSLQWVETDLVDVYVNGLLSVSSISIGAGHVIDISASPISVDAKDIIDVVRPFHILTDEEREFDPDVEDDGTVMVQYRETTEYTTTTEIVNGQTITNYFYWVENTTTRNENDNTSLSLQATRQQLIDIPTPHMVLMKPVDDPVLIDRFGYGSTYGVDYSLPVLPEEYATLPVFYRQAVLRKSAYYLNEDNRYVLRFTRDLTLRDDINNDPRKVNLKSKHHEWFLFRREQDTNVPQELWNKMIEAIVGFKLSDPTIRVPSFERELYDAANGTQTRYGLGEGQAFANGNYALQTILAYLRDPNVDFYPMDINAFFQTYSFDTPQNIIVALRTVYNTFGVNHVNTIWFNVLQDALATQPMYKDLLKTSWVALHGIRVLEVGGLFDD